MTTPTTAPAPGLIKVAKLIANCRRNDPAAVQAGGPPVLGFTFYVPEIAASSLVQFVKTWLHKCHLPMLSVDVEKGEMYLATPDLWTRKKIEDAIRASDMVRLPHHH